MKAKQKTIPALILILIFLATLGFYSKAADHKVPDHGQFNCYTILVGKTASRSYAERTLRSWLKP